MIKKSVICNCIAVGVISLSPVVGYANETNIIEANASHQNIQEGVIFEDINLHKAINEYLGKEDLNSYITESELLSIEDIDLSFKDIRCISGIGKLLNLKSVNLSGNKLSDVSELNKLPFIENINISGNNIFDISPLSSLKNVKIDASNQEIRNDKGVFHNKNYMEKSKIVSIEGLDVNFFDISNEGYFDNGDIFWTNLPLDNIILEYSFSSSNENIIYSGKVKKELEFKGLNELDIELSYNTSWTNKDLEIFYKLRNCENSEIEKIIFPYDFTSNDLEGSFYVKDNGVYEVNIILKNGECFTKQFEIKNVDKKSPVVSNINISTDKDKLIITFEALDNLSGIDGSKIEGLVYAENGFFRVELPLSSEFITIYDNASNSTLIDLENKISCSGHSIYVQNVSLYLGDNFNPMDYVKAIDCNGNNVTDSVRIIRNDVNANQLGSYEVVYEITDCIGNKIQKTIVVDINEKPKEVIDPDLLNGSTSEISSIIDKGESTQKSSGMSSKDVSSVSLLLSSSLFAGLLYLFKSNKNHF